MAVPQPSTSTSTTFKALTLSYADRIRAAAAKDAKDTPASSKDKDTSSPSSGSIPRNSNPSSSSTSVSAAASTSSLTPSSSTPTQKERALPNGNASDSVLSAPSTVTPAKAATGKSDAKKADGRPVVVNKPWDEVEDDDDDSEGWQAVQPKARAVKHDDRRSQSRWGKKSEGGYRGGDGGHRDGGYRENGPREGGHRDGPSRGEGGYRGDGGYREEGQRDGGRRERKNWSHHGGEQTQGGGGGWGDAPSPVGGTNQASHPNQSAGSNNAQDSSSRRPTQNQAETSLPAPSTTTTPAAQAPTPTSPSLGTTTTAQDSSVSTSAKATSQPPQNGAEEANGWDSPSSMEGSWRKKPTAPEPVAAAPVKQPAGPPAVNIWQVRKEKMVAAAPKAPAGKNENAKSNKQAAAQAHAQGSAATSQTKQPNNEDGASRRSNAVPGSSTKGPGKAGKVDGSRAGPMGAKLSSNEVKVVPPPVADPSAWPDVQLAATVTAKPTNLVPESKEKEDTQSVSTSAGGQTGGKKEKTKWIPIPAAEMQAELDKVQRAKRGAALAAERAAQGQEVNGRSKRASPSGQAPFDPSKPSPKAPGGKKAAGKGVVIGGGEVPKKAKAAPMAGKSPNLMAMDGEVRLPPAPGGQAKKEQFKPVFGTFTPADGRSVASETSKGTVEEKVGEGLNLSGLGPPAVAASVLESRRESNVGVESSQSTEGRRRSTVSAESITILRRASSVDSRRAEAAAAGTMPSSVASTPALPSQTLAAGMPTAYYPAGTVPSSGRGAYGGPGNARGARGGRGGYRGNARGGFGQQGLPTQALPFGNHTGRQAAFVPQVATAATPLVNGKTTVTGSNVLQNPNSAIFQPMDPSLAAAQAMQYGYGGYGYPTAAYYGQQPLPYYVPEIPLYEAPPPQRPFAPAQPPPPMPVTLVPGLDMLRMYILGQLEYYFGMQNLAMDFFLRQQMDSQGWIDIAMIASFNRVKSLTTDVALVKEMLLLSTILEVREDKVRLAKGQHEQWLLPNATPSVFSEDMTTNIEQIAGGKPATLPSETRDRIMGDVSRDVLKNGGISSGLDLAMAIGKTAEDKSGGLSEEDGTSGSATGTVGTDDLVAEPTPATSVDGDAAGEKGEQEAVEIGL